MSVGNINPDRGTRQIDLASFTAGTTKLTPVGGVFNDGLAALTSGQQGTLRATAQRGLHINLRNNAGTEIGTVTTPVRVDPTGTTIQPVNGTVTANIGTTNGLALDATVAKLTIAQGAALGTNTQALIGASVTTAAPTYTTGQISPLSLNTSGGLRVDGSAVTQPISGTITSNQGIANATPWNENIAQIAGATSLTGNGVTGAGSLRMTIASDNTAFQIIPAASSSGAGASMYFNSALTAKASVKASSGRMYGYHIQNPNNTDGWVQVFDVALASVTLGTTVPNKSLWVPAGGAIDAPGWAIPPAFVNAITIAGTTTPTGAITVTTGLVVNIDYL